MNTDPYSAPDSNFSFKIDDFSSICYIDMANYLVSRPSPFSADDMRAYKSPEAYNQTAEKRIKKKYDLPYLGILT